jgi:hypothetical protein
MRFHAHSHAGSLPDGTWSFHHVQIIDIQDIGGNLALLSGQFVSLTHAVA